jgi:wyosine [tRNA(Phe)-imidazoG37] synthetase (radical SAM superfamily)
LRTRQLKETDQETAGLPQPLRRQRGGNWGNLLGDEKHHEHKDRRAQCPRLYHGVSDLFVPDQPMNITAAMTSPTTIPAARNGAARLQPNLDTAFGCPRDFLQNRFIYVVISPRARGLSIGVNMNPDKRCNYDCVYCEVNRSGPAPETQLDVPVMTAELERTLELIRSGGIREYPRYRSVPPELLELRHVTLSGDGEPTLCPNFSEAVEAIVQFRARNRSPFFKLVLVTNATFLDRSDVLQSLGLFTSRDEVWAKLEAGTQAYMARIHKTEFTLEKLLANILEVAQRRPVIIQSLFPSINGEGPPPGEIEAYAERLKELKNAGAQISLVQIYSATRPTPHSECGHLPLRTLSMIARRVREVAGLEAEVF